MKKILFILLLPIVFLDANFLKKELIKEGFISKNKLEYKSYEKFDLSSELFKEVSIKFELNKKVLENKNYYAKITCDVNNIVYSNISYEVNLDSIMVKLDKNTPSTIYFDIKYEKIKKLNFRVFLLNEFEYKYLVKKENIIFGIAYGIIFCAFLYNFVIFIYTFQRSFLYYSLMQISLLIVLYYITVFVSSTYITIVEQILIDFFETLSMLLTVLFSKEILNTKKYMKKINSILNFFVYINIVDLIFIFIFNISLLYEYLPRTVILFVLIIAGSISLRKGQKTAIFYLLGWMVLFVSLLLSEYKLIEINLVYILHIGLPIESLILSFALGYKLKQTVEEKKEKEKFLVHQSKLASMGEMINNIAHQWRQPLAHLSFINMDLQMAGEHNDLNKKYLLNKLNESNNQIDFMSETIDNFRDFYAPTKEKEFFKVSLAVQNAIDIIKPLLDFANIKIVFNISNDKNIIGYKNEYSQVILNFLTNAKEVLLEKKIQKPTIKINLQVKNKKTILSVEDNAGGINEDLIEKIFEPYFTTKDKSSGIGLYMSKTIIDSHFKGNIRVENTKLGASFIVEV